MEPTSSTERFAPLSEQDQSLLHSLACEAIEGAFAGQRHTLYGLSLPPALRRPGACFVTLETAGELRGCIGSLEIHRPLAEDAQRNACAAAFEDPRFSPLRRDEWPSTHLTLSVLGPPSTLEVPDEESARQSLAARHPGVILQEADHTSTFLPEVWEKLPDPEDFLNALKVKAGLPPTHWSPALHLYLYSTQRIPA